MSDRMQFVNSRGLADDVNSDKENGLLAMRMLRDTIAVVCCVIGLVVGFSAFAALGPGLRLTIVSTDENDPTPKGDGDAK